MPVRADRICVGDLVIHHPTTLGRSPPRYKGIVWMVTEGSAISPYFCRVKQYAPKSTRIANWPADALVVVCANCYKPLDQHVNGKCLFQSTELLR